MKISKSAVLFAFICLTPFTCDARATESCLNKYEVYSFCGGHCEPSCFDRDPICLQICTGGCVCYPGMVRDEAGECVGEDTCPISRTAVTRLEPCLKENEVFDVCRGHCDATCFDPEPKCTRDCNKGCLCAPGLFRNEAGDCVTMDQCPTDQSMRSVRSIGVAPLLE